MIFSNMVNSMAPNILTTLENKRREIILQGKEVINLSAGTPDLPPDRHVMETLSRECLVADNYKYAISDSTELVDAACGWYSRRFGVELSRDQVSAVYGSQEGIAHIAFPICNPGDVVLVPDPGYPIFSFGPLLAGAKLHTMPLLKENNYLIDFDAIDKTVAQQAKMMIVSYPNNPSTATASADFYERLVAFAHKYDIVVIHDNAYSELVLDGSGGRSFLQTKGAIDVGIEFNSLSKSYNLTGMRMSFALGNRDIIENFRKLRSQIDYGPFRPIQTAAIAVLEGPQDILERNRTQYKLRRDTFVNGLRKIGWAVEDCNSTMFTWFSLPQGFTDDEAFTLDLLEKAGVIGVPGSSFGEMGRGFMRFALVLSVKELESAVAKIAQSGILLGR